MLSKPRFVAFFVLVGALACGPCLLRVWVRQQNVSLGYDLHQKEGQREALRVQIRNLEVTRAAQRTPRALMALADRLGLAPARPDQFLRRLEVRANPLTEPQGRLPLAKPAARDDKPVP